MANHLSFPKTQDQLCGPPSPLRAAASRSARWPLLWVKCGFQPRGVIIPTSSLCSFSSRGGNCFLQFSIFAFIVTPSEHFALLSFLKIKFSFQIIGMVSASSQDWRMHCLPELLWKINSLIHIKHGHSAWHRKSAQWVLALTIKCLQYTKLGDGQRALLALPALGRFMVCWGDASPDR